MSMTALAASPLQRSSAALVSLASAARGVVTSVYDAMIRAGEWRARRQVLNLAHRYESIDPALARELRSAAQSTWY
jgi:hypothetical protein